MTSLIVLAVVGGLAVAGLSTAAAVAAHRGQETTAIICGWLAFSLVLMVLGGLP